MSALQIAISVFGFWLSIIGPIAALVWNIRRETHDELREQRQHWAELLKSFCDFKNVTVERFAKLENKDQ